MKIIIIEDEKPIAKDLERTLQRVNPAVEIVATLHSVASAVRYFQTQPAVDLIFSDIQLGDGLSFEVFQQIDSDTPVIFCTAYNEYALKAFEANGIDYILKPFGKASIQKALDKFQKLQEQFAPKQANQPDFGALVDLLKIPKPVTTKAILVNHKDKIIPVNLDRIALFFIEDRYVFAFTFDQKKYLVSQKLDQLEESCGTAFFRANRQFLVNRKAIRDVSHFFKRKLLLNLTVPFEEQITVGKVKTPEFLAWLGG
jgi:two-component system response regulator LytT